MGTGAIDAPEIARRAFEDAAPCLRAMPLVILDTVLLATLLSVASAAALPALQLSAPFRALIEVLLTAIVLAPMSVAVYRFVLLKEMTPRLGDALRAPSFGRFLRASLVVSFLTLAGYLGGALASEAIAPPLGTMVFFFAFAATTLLTVRIALLFPALASGAPGAIWPRAVADSAGHGWRIFFALALCSIPFLFAGLPLDGLSREVAPLRPVGMILSFLAAILEVSWTLVLAIAGARMYQAVGLRLRKPL